MTTYSKPFRLSAAGSTRATAYKFSNKSVTLDGRTHVTWLDAVARVCTRTYDHAAGAWSETWQPFKGCDNHTTPALTVDADGRIHIVFGPHGWWGGWNFGCFKHAVAEAPNRIDAFGACAVFGYNATYGSITHTPAGLDAVVYRGGEAPSAVMFQRQRATGGWTWAQPLMRQDVEPQYTHVAARVVCAPDGTLYVGGHFYNTSAGRSLGAAVLKSTDMGATWRDMAGRAAGVPILYDERFAIPHPANSRMEGLALDSAGALWALSCSATQENADVLVSRWTGNGWEIHDAAPALPDGWLVDWSTLTIDTRDRIHLAVSAAPARDGTDDEMKLWGHPSHEVFHLCSTDGARSFECNMISEPDETASNWLPAMSHAGLHHPVEKPVILYTHGSPGEGCSPETTTEVYCVMVE